MISNSGNRGNHRLCVSREKRVAVRGLSWLNSTSGTALAVLAAGASTTGHSRLPLFPKAADAHSSHVMRELGTGASCDRLTSRCSRQAARNGHSEHTPVGSRGLRLNVRPLGRRFGAYVLGGRIVIGIMKEPESWRHLSAGFGDRVRIRRAPETESADFAGRCGVVHGVTTVSVTGVSVVGTPTDDTALNVCFEESNDNAWFAPQLVEFVDHDPGTSLTLDGVPKKWTRDASGRWIESGRTLSPKEWRTWLRGIFRKMVRR